MTDFEIQEATDADGRDLLLAAELNWARPVPHCPGWSAADLVGHVGRILAWMDTIVTGGERVQRRDIQQPPSDSSDLPDWYSTQLARTLNTLKSADSTTQTWTFSKRGDNTVGWWRRRLAVELGIHRWDMQNAVALDTGSETRPVDGDVAAAGIEEFVTEFLPGLLAADGVEGLSGSVHVHATDGPSEWWVDLDPRADTEPVAGHLKADTAVRGTRSDLLLWLVNRDPASPIEVLGRDEVVTAWTQLRL